MRTFSSNINQILLQDSITPFVMVSITATMLTRRDTSLPFDVTFDGTTYTSDNGLVSVEPPRLSTVVDRAVYKITYADEDFSMKAAFTNGIVGAPVTVYIGFINTTSYILNGVNPGHPLLSTDDVLIGYRGVIDSYGYSSGTESGILAAFECSSPMSDLGLLRAFYTSQDSLRQFSPTDTAFNQVYAGSKAISLLWGKV